MKITIELNEKTLQSEIAETLSERLESKLECEVQKAVSAKLKALISDKVSEWVQEALGEPLNITDNWGRTIETTNFRDLVIATAKTFLSEKVNYQGNTDVRYGEAIRRNWIAYNAAKMAVDDALKPELDSVVAEARKQIKEKAAEVLANAITSLAASK